MYIGETSIIILLVLFNFGNQRYIDFAFVTVCPSGKENWERRAQEQKCNSTCYHCISINNNRLVETCIRPKWLDQISKCPWLDILKPAKASDSFKLKECLGEHTECPQNASFLTSDLFKYPGCVPGTESAQRTKKYERLTSEILAKNKTMQFGQMETTRRYLPTSKSSAHHKRNHYPSAPAYASVTPVLTFNDTEDVPGENEKPLTPISSYLFSGLGVFIVLLIVSAIVWTVQGLRRKPLVMTSENTSSNNVRENASDEDDIEDENEYYEINDGDIIRESLSATFSSLPSNPNYDFKEQDDQSQGCQ